MSGSEPQSVLLIGNFLSGHVGNFSVCEDLAKKLEAAGLNVTTASDRKSRLPRLVDIVATVLRKRHDYSVASVDVYSGLAFGLAEAACYALRSIGKPYVLTLRGGNLPKYAQQRPARVARLFRGASVVTTPSEYLMQHMQCFRDDLRLLPNPLHLDRYQYRCRDRVKPNLIWVRSFHKIYNPMLAPRVIADLAAMFPDVELTMVGPDKRDGSLEATKQVAEELGVLERIRFTGGVPKESVPEYLSKADLLINTTNVDNTPTTVLEAMACGLCVVSTDVGGMPHLVEHEKNALLVPPGDSLAMAQSVQRALSDPNLSHRLSSAAHEHAKQFDWETILPRWVSLFAEIVHDH